MSRPAAVLVIVLSAVADCGCALGLNVQLRHAPRCEVRYVQMRWFDQAGETIGHSMLALNVCRYGQSTPPPEDPHGAP